MSSLFDVALSGADNTILNTMMSDWEINGVIYPAVFDESQRTMDGILSQDELSAAGQGTSRVLTLYRSTGYKPRVGDTVSRGVKSYFVKSYYYEDGLIYVRLE
ncbi:phage tail protein [Actinobacillus pleuropneumoniae]|uniref:Phage protein n=1 Tax=Actinobacillus pleuropneumoniae TaxID=715 RepID=A0A3S4YIK6_ACTPL|nr:MULTISPECIES: phage tail protein [Actinobacillus]QSZ38516.1 phage tail protein [Actinobacillus pleuropneumoniae]VEJ16413.1 Uncharacterised protein [Actinobacillus pleuropneumoniae]